MVIRILLADNHEVYRSAIRAMLTRQPGFQIVAEVGDGHAALTAVQRFRPQIVLMDIGMPVLDGIDATRAIMAEAPSVRVLGLSLHADAAIVQAMVDAGARGYVLKEDLFDDLVNAIRDVAAGGLYFSQRLQTAPDRAGGSGA
jgi:two-component system NarL family response regulator